MIGGGEREQEEVDSRLLKVEREEEAEVWLTLCGHGAQRCSARTGSEAVILSWEWLSLNPAIWEAIAGTRWGRDDRDYRWELGEGESKAPPSQSEGGAPNGQSGWRHPIAG